MHAAHEDGTGEHTAAMPCEHPLADACLALCSPTLLCRGDSVGCIQAGGAMGILAAALAWYAALASMLTKTTSAFTLPVGDLTVPTRPTLTREQLELVAMQQNQNKV